MTDPTLYLTLAAAGLVALGITTCALLSGWRGWLALKREELTAAAPSSHRAPPTTGARIEIADLKERIRKLEAIAAGVEL